MFYDCTSVRNYTSLNKMMFVHVCYHGD
uniref:Uncharacterized protein n=1 Tax=Triticum urartu TaxID=4572 RepID=A0A8R7QAV1_TRIUA